jgi:Zinc finger, C3HC4 type (RING finger)
MEVFKSEECVICMECDSSNVFDPCHHQCCCGACSDGIRKANMPCPLCRQDILDIVSVQYQTVPVVIPTEGFDRDAYISEMRGKVANNAGFKGNSKFAKSVNRSIVGELEQRQMETKGGERCTGKNIKTEKTEEKLNVEYKVGRKIHKESYDWMELEDAKNGLLEGLAGDSLDVLDCAIWHPEFYWCFYHHLNGKELENFFRDSGILNNKRRK